MKKNYVLWAIPKGGGQPFLSYDYKGSYTRCAAEEIAEKQNAYEDRTNSYAVLPKGAPAPPFNIPKIKVLNASVNIVTLNSQIARLKTVSERQSVMLAKALKEKNDLLGKVTSTDADYYVRQIKQLQLDLSAAHTQLRAVRTLAKDFFEALGVK